MRILIILLMAMAGFSSNAQNENWSFLSNANIVYEITDSEDSILCYTNAGLLKSAKNGTGFRMMDTPEDKLYNGGICYDTSGNIWISNNGSGLYSFNSSGWTFFNSLNSPLLLNYTNSIHFLNGKLWVSTGSGLNSFDGSSWETFTTSNSGIPGNYVNDVASGSDGVIWVATYSGLGSYSNATWTVYDTLNTPFEVENIAAIDVDDSNHVWVATRDDNAAGGFAAGIFMFDGQNWNSFPGAIYPGSQITLIHCAENNQVLFGSRTSIANGWYSSGLSVYNGNTWIKYDSLNSDLTNYEINSITSDTIGNVFIGTQGNYVFVFANGVFQNRELKNCEIPSNVVSAMSVSGDKIYTSSASNLVQWNQEFLSYFNGLAWLQLDTIDASCTFIEFVNDSVAFAGYGYELHRLEGSTDSLFITPPDLGSFNDIAIDAAGSVWFATSNGIGKYDSGNWTLYNTGNSGLPDDYVYNIVSSGNNIWVSTLSGIAFFDNTFWTVYDTLNSPLLPGYTFQMCLSDSALYVGPFSQTGWPTTYLGIQKIDLVNNIPVSWNLIDTSNSILPTNKTTVINANQHEVWVGTSEGVIRLDTNIVYSTFNSPLLHNNIYDIAFSNNGKKWFATDRYISIYHSDSLLNSIESSGKFNFSMYPNPANIFIKIEGDFNLINSVLDIFSMNGVFVKREIIKSDFEVNVKSIDLGNYIFRISSADGTEIENHLVTIINR